MIGLPGTADFPAKTDAQDINNSHARSIAFYAYVLFYIFMFFV